MDVSITIISASAQFSLELRLEPLALQVELLDSIAMLLCACTKDSEPDMANILRKATRSAMKLKRRVMRADRWAAMKGSRGGHVLRTVPELSCLEDGACNNAVDTEAASSSEDQDGYVYGPADDARATASDGKDFSKSCRCRQGSLIRGCLPSEATTGAAASSDGGSSESLAARTKEESNINRLYAWRELPGDIGARTHPLDSVPRSGGSTLAAMTSVEGFVADFNALSGGLSAAAASTLRSSGRPGSSRRTEANSSSGEFQAEMQDEEDYGDEECEGNSSPSAAARRTQREIRIRSRRSSRPQPTGAEASIGRPLMPGSEASLGLLSSGRASVELLWAERTNSQPASPHLSLPEQVRLTLRMRARGAGMAWPYNPVSTNRGATASAGTTRRPTGRSETASKRTQGAMDLARDLEGTATSSCSLGRVALEEALRVPVQDSLPPTPSAALPLQRLRVFSVNGSVPHARRLLDAGFDIQLLGFTRRPSCTVNISSSSEAPAASVASPAVPASTKALQTSSKATSTVSADATTAAPAARSGSFKAAADRADLVQQQSPRQQQKLQPLRDQQKLGNSEELCDAERCSLEGMRRGYEVLLRLIQLLEPSYEVPTVSGASFFEPRPELRGEAEASIDSFGTIAACTDEVPAALDLATTSFDLDAAIGPLPGEAPEEQRDPVALPGCGRSFSADALRRGEDIDVAAPSAAELDELPPTPTRSHASNRAEEGAEESHGSSASGWFTWIPRLPVFMR
ncbi:unnamed protein product [Polarella glacialis]|uniref:Uncharacterized protein n=1 Tax=Polarella glacialis TaxID=89957 RepID=A0A813L066_POLGL|nr:unnamed protein product [Polarella glacialis]